MPRIYSNTSIFRALKPVMLFLGGDKRWGGGGKYLFILILNTCLSMLVSIFKDSTIWPGVWPQPEARRGTGATRGSSVTPAQAWEQRGLPRPEFKLQLCQPGSSCSYSALFQHFGGDAKSPVLLNAFFSYCVLIVQDGKQMQEPKEKSPFLWQNYANHTIIREWIYSNHKRQIGITANYTGWRRGRNNSLADFVTTLTEIKLING